MVTWSTCWPSVGSIARRLAEFLVASAGAGRPTAARKTRDAHLCVVRGPRDRRGPTGFEPLDRGRADRPRDRLCPPGLLRQPVHAYLGHVPSARGGVDRRYRRICRGNRWRADEPVRPGGSRTSTGNYIAMFAVAASAYIIALAIVHLVIHLGWSLSTLPSLRMPKAGASLPVPRRSFTPSAGRVTGT